MDVAGYDKTFSMDQGQILGNDQVFQALFNAPLSDGKRDGICAGLSMIWVARRMMFHDETPTQRAAALVSMPGFGWGGKSQDWMGGGGTGSVGAQFAGMHSKQLSLYGLRVDERSAKFVRHTTANTDAGAIWDTVRHTGTYCLFNIGLDTGTGAAAHMVASYVSHGTLGMSRHFYLFDPNMGEYRLSLSDGEDFLEKWIEAYEDAFVGVTYLAAFEVVRA